MGRQSTPSPSSPSFQAKKVGELIKTERENNGWTQSQLARQAGVAKQVVSNIERGAVTASVNTLAAVAHAIGLTIQDIIDVGFGKLPQRELQLIATTGALLRKLSPDGQELALRQLRAILAWEQEQSRKGRKA